MKIQKNKVIMKKKDFLKEHLELNKILKSGNKKGISKELKEQGEEVVKVKKTIKKK